MKVFESKEELLEHGVRGADYEIVCRGCRGSGVERMTVETDEGVKEKVLCNTCTVDDPSIRSVWMGTKVLPFEHVKIRETKVVDKSEKHGDSE